MFTRILIACWAVIFAAVGVSGIFPRLAIPLLTSLSHHTQAALAFILSLTFISFVYAVIRLYREGMKRASR